MIQFYSKAIVGVDHKKIGKGSVSLNVLYPLRVGDYRAIKLTRPREKQVDRRGPIELTEPEVPYDRN